MIRPRRKRRTARRYEPTRDWVWRGVMVAAVVVAIGVFVLVQSEFKEEKVDERLCPSVSGPVAGLAILLDLTDSLQPVQHRRLEGLLERRIDDAAHNTLIAVGAVRTGASEQGEDFSLCKPMKGKDANEYYQNPRMVEERYRKEFLEPFERRLSSMMRSPSADRSPIMESLQTLLVSAPGFVDASYPRRVIIVSDLIQNSEAFSFYRGDTWGRFIRSPDAQRLAGRLQDVEVEICRIPRPDAGGDMKQVDDFWIRYLDRAGVLAVLTSSCPLGDL